MAQEGFYESVLEDVYSRKDTASEDDCYSLYGSLNGYIQDTQYTDKVTCQLLKDARTDMRISMAKRFKGWD